jgi:hypothetical protein
MSRPLNHDCVSRDLGVSRVMRDKGLWDTMLSSAGVEQAIELHKQLREQSDAGPSPASHVVPWERVDLIIVLPPRCSRTNCSSSKHPLLSSTLPTVPRYVHPLLRERLYLSSEADRPRSMQQAQFRRLVAAPGRLALVVHALVVACLCLQRRLIRSPPPHSSSVRIAIARHLCGLNQLTSLISLGKL